MSKKDKITIAAVTIQKCWRGYHTRKRIAKAQGAFAHLQRLFKLRLENRRQESRLIEQKRNHQLDTELQRCRANRLTLERRFQLLFNRDPDLVDQYLSNESQRAAINIQKFWRGYRARRDYRQARLAARRETAAIKIQKSFRKYLLKKKWRKKADVWPKLSDARRSQLQTEVIDRWIQQKIPVPSTIHLETKLQECYEMIVSKSAKSVAEGRNFDRRNVLLAKLQLDSETLETAPKLSNLNCNFSQDWISMFKSRSTAVNLVATKAHDYKMDSTVRRKWWLVESAVD